jgi:Fe-S cluster biosynthesis and repair protein YggX
VQSVRNQDKDHDINTMCEGFSLSLKSTPQWQSLLKSAVLENPTEELHGTHCPLHQSLEKEAEGLDFPPYPGDLGKRIWENVSKDAWAAWLKHQTMLVNENRLNLADLRARQYLARQMENHFFGDGADAAQGYVPPPAA